MTPLSVGIIGFGRIGNEHAGWLALADNIRATAVADATPARQQLAASRGLTVYPDIDALLNDSAIDAVLVSTPTAMHFDHVQRALAAGKHVMVEKPMALDLAQARQMLDHAGRVKKVLSVFHNRRWDLDYLAVRQLLESQTLGKLINVESRLAQFASCVGPAAREYRPGWRNEAAFGGGALYDWGSHFLDQIWRLLWPARPTTLFAQLGANVWSTDCDDFARVLLNFDTGAVALVEINTTTHSPVPRWRIDGTTASAQSPHSQSFDTQTWSQLHLLPAHNLPAGGLPPSFLIPHPSSLPSPLLLTEPDLWTHFARAIQTGSLPAVPPNSVLPTMQLLAAARQSAKSAQSIPINSTDWTY